MLGLLLMTLLPVAIVSVLPLGGTTTDDDAADAHADPDYDGYDPDGDEFADIAEAEPPAGLAEVHDFIPAKDRLQLVVDGDGHGSVSLAPDPDGRGTLVSYDGAVVALVHGHDADEIGPVDVIARDTV